MGVLADGFAEWLRDYIVADNPASGVNPPSKARAGRSDP
jgi:hypothetical protein